MVTRRQPRGYRPSFSLPLLIIVGLVLYFYLNAPEPILETNKLLGLGIIIAALVPSLIYIQKVRNPQRAVEPLPLLPILGLIYGFYYGLPALVEASPDVNVNIPVSHPELTDALVYALVGWLFLLVGFYLFSPPLVAKVRPLRLSWDLHLAKQLATYLLIIGFLVQISGSERLLPSLFRSILGLLASFYALGMGIYIFLDAQQRLSRRQSRVLWIAIVPYYFLVQIATGLVFNLIYAVVFLLLLVWGSGRRIPWRWVVPLAFLVVLLYGTQPQYRQSAWYGPYHEAGVLNRGQLFLSLAWENVQEQGLNAFNQALQSVQERSDYLSLFAYVVAMTPSWIPYWNGGSYYALPTTWIPRAIYPYKPENNVGQLFGHRYYILDPWDQSTSVNMPQTVEMYANFGINGVVIGMFLLGIIYRVLYSKLNQPGVSAPVILIAAFIFKDLINIESDFTLIFGSIVQTVIVLYFVMRWASKPKNYFRVQKA